MSFMGWSAGHGCHCGLGAGAPESREDIRVNLPPVRLCGWRGGRACTGQKLPGSSSHVGNFPSGLVQRREGPSVPLPGSSPHTLLTQSKAPRWRSRHAGKIESTYQSHGYMLSWLPCVRSRHVTPPHTWRSLCWGARMGKRGDRKIDSLCLLLPSLLCKGTWSGHKEGYPVRYNHLGHQNLQF